MITQQCEGSSSYNAVLGLLRSQLSPNRFVRHKYFRIFKMRYLRHFRSRNGILATCCFCIVVLLWISTNIKSSNKVVSLSTLRHPLPNERLLAASLLACDTPTGGGIGNVAFEIISFIGIARKLNRTPTIYSSMTTCIDKLRYFHVFMPNLTTELAVIDQPWLINYPSHTPDHLCFEYFDAFREFASLNAQKVVATEFSYLQNFAFISALSRQAVLSLLSFNEDLLFMARYALVDDIISSRSHHVCVHTRRGDFVTEEFHLESEEQPTLLMTKYVVDQLVASSKTDIRIIVLGQDTEWEKEIFKNFPVTHRIDIARTGSDLPTMIDWAFSKQFCDTTIITASVSSYAVWLALVSRGGNDVYYRKKYSKYVPAVPASLWSPEWKPLDV